MKTRNFFISNSSSSSFIVSKEDLTKSQLICIIKHRLIADIGLDDSWIIDDNEDGSIEGRCNMDNFSMREYMEEIGIDLSKVRFEYD